MHKSLISTEVLAGLEAVRLSGKTNMLDAPRVIELAFEMEHYETALWVHENRGIYVQGIFQGFTVSEPEAVATASPDNRTHSRHVAQHGATDGDVGKTSDECGTGDTFAGGENPCVDR